VRASLRLLRALPGVPAEVMSHGLLVWKSHRLPTSINSHLFSSRILNCASLSRYDSGAGGGDATTTAVDGGAGAGGGAWAVGSAIVPRELQRFKIVEVRTKSGASQYLKVPTQYFRAHAGLSHCMCAKMR
jgi:hypothetical protein